jgi:cytoskeletal protein RodZ
MIEKVCTQFKEKRQSMGLTIEEVVEKTKLHPSVIRDLEEGDLHKINPTYLKGFIRIYASFLGVELGGALEEIPSAQPQTEYPRTTVKKRNFKEISPHVKKIIIQAVVGFFIVWLAFVVVRGVFRGIVGFFKNRPAKVVEKVEKKVIATKPEVDSEELAVSLTVKRDCFLRVTVDGKLLFEGILSKGSIETWQAKDKMELKISDGSAVYIEVNGKSLPELTSRRKPIKALTITHTGISVDK